MVPRRVAPIVFAPVHGHTGWGAVDSRLLTGRAGSYRGKEHTFTFLREYAAAHGPFDGVVGFSQGGALGEPPLTVSIFYCCAREADRGEGWRGWGTQRPPSAPNASWPPQCSPGCALPS